MDFSFINVSGKLITVDILEIVYVCISSPPILLLTAHILSPNLSKNHHLQ